MESHVWAHASQMPLRRGGSADTVMPGQISASDKAQGRTVAKCGMMYQNRAAYSILQNLLMVGCER